MLGKVSTALTRIINAIAKDFAWYQTL